MKLLVGIFIGVLLLPYTPAFAHDAADIERYTEEWTGRVVANGGLSDELLEEYQDFQDRHAWYFYPQAVTSEPSYVTSREVYSPQVEEWRPLVAGHFAPQDVDTALCLMYYESKGNPYAKNPTSSASGLFQILSFWWRDTFGLDPFIPEQNVWMARRIKDQQGWYAWNPYKRGLCR